MHDVLVFRRPLLSRSISPLIAPLLLASACGPAPSAAPVVVSIPPAPTPTSTETAAATPDAGAAPEVAESSACDAAAEMEKIDAIPHDSMENCEAVRDATNTYYGTCDPDVQASSRAFFKMTECVEDLAHDRLKKVVASLPERDRARRSAALENVSTHARSLCTRPGCGMTFESHCIAGFAMCWYDQLDAAVQRTLELQAGKPEGKDVRVLEPYAKAICALPRDAWKSGAPPARCLERELAYLESCAGPPLGCSQP